MDLNTSTLYHDYIIIYIIYHKIKGIFLWKKVEEILSPICIIFVLLSKCNECRQNVCRPDQRARTLAVAINALISVQMEWPRQKMEPALVSVWLFQWLRSSFTINKPNKASLLKTNDQISYPTKISFLWVFLLPTSCMVELWSPSIMTIPGNESSPKKLRPFWAPIVTLLVYIV